MQDLDEIFGAGGPLARALPGFRPRASQRRMAEQVALTLAARGRLLVEAGTGTGKTFAYLIPALLSGGKVIVSTGTRTLQDQLFARDIPLLAAVLGRIARIALLKGRSNYLCRERLLRPQGELQLDGAAQRSLLGRIREWSDSTRSGDLAEVPELSDGHPLRARITSTRDSCLGSRCAEFSRCHVFAARRAAADADLVIVNHHLLLADLALKEEGYGDLLPTADAVILDEAHQVPDLAAQFFGASFGSRQVDLLLQDLRAALLAAGSGPRRLALAEDRLLRALHVAAERIGARVDPQGRVSWDDTAHGLDEALAELAAELAQLGRQIADLGGGESLGQCAQRAAELCEALERIAQASPADGARTVESGSRGFSLQLLPFDVGPRFRAMVDARRCAWIFTSATLTVGEDFAHFSGRLGLAEDTDTLRIESPFDYERQALLYLPTGMPDPAAPGFIDAVVEHAVTLIEASGGGAFLLFTSHRALERASRLLRARWQGAPGGAPPYNIFVQGESPRELLLRDFRDSQRAVLLGTSSFWEGVDVQGEALRLVVIDKLPFASPDDPLTRARVEHIRARGGSPFTEYQLPEAALALKQGVGRLIRSELDQGVVAICDPRLTSRGYGRVLLASLPPMRPSRDADEARRFLRRLAPAAPKEVSGREAAGAGYGQRAVLGRAADRWPARRAGGGDGARARAADPADGAVAAAGGGHRPCEPGCDRLWSRSRFLYRPAHRRQRHAGARLWRRPARAAGFGPARTGPAGAAPAARRRLTRAGLHGRAHAGDLLGTVRSAGRRAAGRRGRAGLLSRRADRCQRSAARGGRRLDRRRAGPASLCRRAVAAGPAARAAVAAGRAPRARCRAARRRGPGRRTGIAARGCRACIPARPGCTTTAGVTVVQ